MRYRRLGYWARMNMALLVVSVGLTIAFFVIQHSLMADAPKPDAQWRVIVVNASFDPDEDFVVTGPVFSSRLACFQEAARLNGDSVKTYSCALVRRP